MRATILIPSLLLAFLALVACQTGGSRSALTGEWVLRRDGDAVCLLRIFPDDTFHVDVLAGPGIEAEGTIEVTDGIVTFVNERGSDAVASDAAPGTYRYRINDNTLSFEKLSDPLERRAGFLAQDWQRARGQAE